jgi:hypothetical protein
VFDLIFNQPKSPDKQDWAKLVKIMCYLKNTHNDVMVLRADDSQGIIWHVDAEVEVQLFQSL